MKGMVKDLETPWTALELTLQQRQTELIKVVEEVTNTAIERCGESTWHSLQTQPLKND